MIRLMALAVAMVLSMTITGADWTRAVQPPTCTIVLMGVACEVATQQIDQIPQLLQFGADTGADRHTDVAADHEAERFAREAALEIEPRVSNQGNPRKR
jgi:hypothetical protein